MGAVTASFYDWSVNPDDNATVGNVNWQEGQPPSTVNNSARQEMSHPAAFREDTTGTITSTGSLNNYAVTIQSQITSYFRGLSVVFKSNHRNTGSATLAVTPSGGTSLGSQPLRALDGQELGSGDIPLGAMMVAHYDGSQFLLINPGVGTVTVDNLDPHTRGLLANVGDIKAWFTDTPPDGWLICDGEAISRSSYADLFALYGTTFGAGNGSTTFNKPDLRGQALRGLDGRGTGGEDPDEASRTAPDKSATVVGAVPGSRQKHALEDHEHRGSNVPPGPSGTGAAGFGDSVNSQGVSTTSSSPNPGSLDADNLSQTETRMRNVACHFIVLADAAAAGAQATYVAGLSGYRFTYRGDSQDTTLDPGIGRFTLNTTSLDTFTEIAISDQTADTGNADVRSVIDTWGLVAGTNKGTLKLSRSAGPEVFVQATLNATNGQANFTRLTVPGTGLKDGFNGTFTDGESVSFDFFKSTPGSTGAPGAPGTDGIDAGYPWNYDNNTDTTTEPTNGTFRLNAGNTELAISGTNSASENVMTWLRTWNDSTTAGDKGSLDIKQRSTPEDAFRALRISAQVADNTTWMRFTVVQNTVGSTAIANGADCSVAFARTGNEGGSTGGEANTSTNVGTGVGISLTKSGVDLPKRSLLHLTSQPVTANASSSGNEIEFGFDVISRVTTQAGIDDTDNLLFQKAPASPVTLRRMPWSDVLAAILSTVNTWIRGQRKTITVLSATGGPPPEYTPLLQSSQDFDLGAPFTEQRQLNVPSGTPALALNTSQSGEITGLTGAGGSLILGAGWDTIDAGGITIGANEAFTLYYRSANTAAAGATHRIVKVKWTA